RELPKRYGFFERRRHEFPVPEVPEPVVRNILETGRTLQFLNRIFELLLSLDTVHDRQGARLPLRYRPKMRQGKNLGSHRWRRGCRIAAEAEKHLGYFLDRGSTEFCGCANLDWTGLNQLFE